MTKSTITRERLEKIKSWRETYGAGSNVMLPAVEAEELALIALAAMDSEPVILYRQVNPVNGMKTYWAELDPEEFRHLKQHTDENAEFMTLYRHAQPAPVVHGEVASAIEELKRTLVDCNRYNYCSDAVARVEVACRAAMLQASPVCTCPSGDGSLRWPCPVHAGNSPVIPDGYVMVPMRLTAENGAKGALSGEFSETKFVNCPECFGDDECETCDGSGRIEITVPVTWTTIKEIWAKGVEHFAAAPQSPGGDHATVPGKWIPVSERMPEREVDVQVYCPDKKEQMVAYLERNELEGYFRFATWRTGDGIYCQPTHWMPLPAAPKEVNRE